MSCNFYDKILQIGNKFQNVFKVKNEFSCIPIFQNGREEKTHQASSRADREYAGNGKKICRQSNKYLQYCQRVNGLNL